MNRDILFEGKVTLGDRLVDFRIYKNNEDPSYYSFEVNPEVRDEMQAGFYRGGIQRSDDLEGLLSHLNLFKREFTTIIEERENTDF